MRPDVEIQRMVIDRLTDAANVDASAIGVSVHRAVVTLDGIVGSDDQRAAAERTVHAVPGVLDVANDIEVRPSWRRTPSDPGIARAIRLALAAIPHLRHEHVFVTVEPNGHVTLRGEVASEKQRAAVLAAAHAVDGVVRVVDCLEIGDA